MKQIVKYLLTAVLSLTFSGGMSWADCPQNKDWREKMRNEKIAFLTTEMDLTPAEAEKFWPLYNQSVQERDAAFKETMQSFNDLQKAVEEGKTGKELSALTERYLKAIAASGQIDQRYMEKYKKVLSAEKIAKLYLGEEKFRRQQIHRLHDRDRSGGAGKGQPQR